METLRSAVKVKKKYQYIGLLYISPWLFGFLLLELYPFLTSFYYSFTSFDLINPPKFIGFKNYIDMFTKDDMFYQSLKVTLIYAIIAVPAKLAFALFVAVVLTAKLKSVNIFRTVYYLPSILGGSVAVAVLWRFLFMKDGIINNLTATLHIPAIDWLGNPSIALYTISMLNVWQFGSSMVLFLAGLKQIPGELYEVGRVEGASKVRMFFSVTLPLLTPILLFNLVMQIVNAFQEFTGAFVILPDGGPLKSTYLFGMKLYDEGFKFLKMGYASSLSWVLFAIILVFTALVFKSSSYWAHYEDGGDKH
ncbi:carbohydrate ABC transporter permease [Paenibacillus radicis (ex Xue et al. 2023)]|uniref:Sugar ABC transporter permease n=1 Tax=Paenibacillus radicis (ex Xue et al. 2023) TaxID=2972489 RepID=A0ABT1YQR0_9BACL|nr:sugar ABC transporter permease [Paenibacillus radicis (ex Xue et al. 2023)]MCR8635060.1 sugar ABC transporter permease [Paenibacillus radicis (ex Xue et al. 2023)]